MTEINGKKMLREMREMVRVRNESAKEENLQPHQAGINLFVNEEFEQAAAAFRQGILLSPDFVFSHYYLGRCLRRLGKYSEAIAAFRQALRLNPLHTPSHAYLGDVFLRENNFAQADFCFRRALELQFDNLTALTGLVKLARNKYNDLDEVAELLKGAYFRGAKNPLLLMELLSIWEPEAKFCEQVADELLHQKSYHRALFFYRLALRYESENKTIRIKINETLRHLNG